MVPLNLTLCTWFAASLQYMIIELQLELITQQAMKAGFTGGLVVDYPNSSKAKK